MAYRSAATAKIQPLAWKPSHARGVALKKKAKRKFMNVLLVTYKVKGYARVYRVTINLTKD